MSRKRYESQIMVGFSMLRTAADHHDIMTREQLVEVITKAAKAVEEMSHRAYLARLALDLNDPTAADTRTFILDPGDDQ